MQFKQIKETCLYIRDLEKAREFYHKRLGMPEISYVEGKHLFLRVGQSVLLLFNPDDSRQKTSPPPHYGSGRQHVAFEVSAEDYNSAKAEMSEKGIAIIDTVVWKNGDESFYFNDPEGNVLEILGGGGLWA